MGVRATKSAAERWQAESRGNRRGISGSLAFLRALWAVDHALRSMSKRMLAELGLTGPQRFVLRILGRVPKIMPSELAELLHLDRGTVSGIVERLVEQQLVVRHAHPHDGRSVLLELSARGKPLDREAPGTVEACVRRALASLPEGKVDAAIEVLEALASELAREAEGRG
jgi:MarR family transcriptional regulator, organic hydroperoxide resistance regulator